MAIEVIMPQGGQDIEVGRVVRWLKEEGNEIVAGEVVCEVETEKAVFEVEAPGSGYLRKIIVPEGDETAILSVIAYIGDLDESIPTPKAPVVEQENITAASSSSEKIAPEHSKSKGKRIPVSPRARRLADEKGISVEQLSGSGAKGRITEKDVLAFIEGQQKGASLGAGGELEGGRIVQVSKIRKVTAQKLQQSKQTIPHFYVTLSVDMTKALNARADFNQNLEKPEDQSISLTDCIVRACALAVGDVPELNSSIFDENSIVLWNDLNIGIAVAVDSELVVPVMEKVDRLSIIEIARERHRLVEKAKQGKQASLAPGRFTISNLGMFNIEQFSAIINPPEIAILAVSSVEKRPVAIDDQQVGLRDMLTLTLSVDHRVIDGVVACRFINLIKTILEDPEQIF